MTQVSFTDGLDRVLVAVCIATNENRYQCCEQQHRDLDGWC